MEGRRFGLGLGAGLIFALAVVAISGSFGSVSGVAPQSKNIDTRYTGVATSTTTGTATQGSAYSVTGTVTSTTVAPGSVNNTQLTSIGGTTTGTYTASQPGGSVQNGQSSNNAPAFSSDLATANQLNTSSRALLLAPLAFAAILGLAIYRASRSKEAPEGS